jgi:sugar/nucleoside kinase (ribokinase family)
MPVSDVIATSSDDFLAEHGVEKGIMQLVDQPRAEALFAAMGSRTETPGGSVANTIAGLGSLGLRTAFIGRVADDDLGHSYALAMQTEGTDFPNPPVRNAELPTSRSMIFVSPDGERSMNTYLGISSDVGPEDVSDAVISRTVKFCSLRGISLTRPLARKRFARPHHWRGNRVRGLEFLCRIHFAWIAIAMIFVSW